MSTKFSSRPFDRALVVIHPRAFDLLNLSARLLRLTPSVGPLLYFGGHATVAGQAYSLTHAVLHLNHPVVANNCGGGL